MATWSEFAESVPAFAERARSLLESGKHKTIATLRADGSPRISGIEAQVEDGQLRFGSMAGALKARDLQRDPRFALHGPTAEPDEKDPSAWPGEVKLAGRAIEMAETEVKTMLAEHGMDAEQFAGSHFFEADIQEVVITRVSGDQLQIELWKPGQDIKITRRS